jgi:hypothetical protein
MQYNRQINSTLTAIVNLSVAARKPCETFEFRRSENVAG